MKPSAPQPDDDVDVWIDQDRCTGDGLCAQLAPEVFRINIDGLAYVVGDDGEMREAPGARVRAPAKLITEVWESAVDCPGECIYLAVGRDSQVAGGGPSNPTGGDPES
ncbi:MAG TPA: ferredoxin [Egibacteraceae bacterium]|nr:ferredoxin [Egibacteraceae bacterium]